MADAVSTLISSGQDTVRHDDKSCEGAEAGTRFRSLQRLVLPPVVTTASYDMIPEFFVHHTKFPYLMSLSSVVRQCKISKYES